MRRILVPILAATLAVTGVLLNVRSTRADAPVFSAPKQYYLALGDSYAFGYQDPKAQAEVKATGKIDPATFNTGYVDQFARFLQTLNPSIQVMNLGCGGETTTTFLNGGCSHLDQRHVMYPTSQMDAAIAFLKAHPGQVSPITLNLGGDDVLTLIGSCGGATSLTAALPCVTKGLPAVLGTMQQNLGKILGTLRALAPDAEIIVLNQDNPFAVVDPSTNVLAGAINQLTAGVASAFKAYIADIYTPFNLAQPQPQTLCAYTAMCTPFHDLHPSDTGYLVMAQAVFAASGYSSLGSVPLAAMVIQMSRVHGLTRVQWYSAAGHVRGFNVYDASTKLNRHPVISTTGWYVFSTRHAIAHLRIIASRGA